jgi:hypothetical protein
VKCSLCLQRNHWRCSMPVLPYDCGTCPVAVQCCVQLWTKVCSCRKVSRCY